MDKPTWHEFATDTTLHGLKQAVSVRPFCRRLIWNICLLTCFVGYMYLLSMNVYTFTSRPVASEISHEFPKDGVDFPVVTVCNLNRFMKFKIDMPYDDENFHKLNLNMSVCGLIRGVSGNLTCGQALLCAYEVFGSSVVEGCSDVIRSRVVDKINTTSRPFNPEEFLTRYGHDFAPMLMIYCRFADNNERCTADDWHPMLSPDGICYSFSKYASRKVYYLGGRGGLSIILDAQTYENTFSDFSLGFRVILSARETYVNTVRGFNAFPGSHTLVAVTPKKFIRLPAPYVANCSDGSGLGRIYTKDACNDQCVLNTTIEDCGCRPVGIGTDVKGHPVCSIQDDLCVEESRARVRMSMCDCAVPCEEYYFEPQVSYSKFPDITVTKILRNFFKLNKSEEYLRDNLVFLQIGFVELAYQVDKQVPSYGAESLFGDIGGNMGLMLGCSFITIVEFLDYIWLVISSKIFVKKTKTTVVQGFENGTITERTAEKDRN